ncbi:MAG: carbohydrate kinase [Verrucomicrobiota bacterium JB023]|nr:carbohydrate kinase [Verrucomicrobiota bacterium JB023]
MNAELKIAGLGETLWDILPSGPQLGGAPTNFACIAQQLGAKAYVVSCVGADGFGRDAEKALLKRGVSTDYLFKHPNLPTGKVKVTLDEQGIPSYDIEKEAAWDHLPCPDSLIAFARQLDAVSFGVLSQRSPDSRRAIRSVLDNMPKDSLRILDVNLRAPYYTKELVTESLEYANILKVSDEELPVLADYYQLEGEVTMQLRQLLERFDLKLLAYTRGANGSILLNDHQASMARALPVIPLNAVAAGDSFIGALTVALLSGYSLHESNRLANRVAAYVCSHQGPTPALPPEFRIVSAIETARAA